MSIRREVIVIGASGHGKVVISTLREAGYVVTAMYDDDSQKWGRDILGVPIVGKIEAQEKVVAAVIAVGQNDVRKQIAGRFKSLEWISVIHPRAIVDSTVKIGAGTVVFAGCVIQPDTTIGAHCIINTAASIDHDCALGDFVHIAPGTHLAGGVNIGEGSFLGIGSCAIPGVSIGKWCIVGAGAVVLKPVEDGATAAGVPARIIHRRSPEKE